MIFSLAISIALQMYIKLPNYTQTDKSSQGNRARKYIPLPHAWQVSRSQDIHQLKSCRRRAKKGCRGETVDSYADVLPDLVIPSVEDHYLVLFRSTEQLFA